MKTFEQHRQRHIKLHKSLDELVADWITETGGIPSKCSLLELMEWSHKQTEAPSDKNNRFGPEKESNAEVSGAGTASAGLPGYAGDNKGE